MFVKDFIEIDSPAPAVLELLRGQPQAVLKDCVQHAAAAGSHLLDSVKLEVPVLQPTSEGEIAISDIVEQESGFVIPVTVREPRLPQLDFDLEFFSMGENLTRVNLTAFYDVSSFLLATPHDKRLLQSVAESVARAYLACLSRFLSSVLKAEAHSTS